MTQPHQTEDATTKPVAAGETMQSDRELLERAARAIGWRVTAYSERRSTGVVDGGMALVVAEGRTFGWSPLHNDGDALRLAVKLGMLGHFRVNISSGAVSTEDPAALPLPLLFACEDMEPDHYAATRRAIVRAAAALGSQQHE